MSEKFVIGLTGNIAAGKSVVKKMLENLGAHTIDADQVAHSAMGLKAPAYKDVLAEFGSKILNSDDEVDRQRLGRIVFDEPEKLEKLEAILHPWVRRAVKYLISRTSKQVVVIEAIKLLESPLKDECNSIWVVTSDEDVQIKRLEINRGMSEEEARARLANQSSQDEKVRQADVIIENEATLVDTWKQVLAAWIVTVVNRRIEVKEHPIESVEAKRKKLNVVYAKPKHAGYIAGFLNEGKPEDEKLEDLDVLEKFGDRAYYLLMEEEEIAGLVGWQVENLIGQVDEIVFSKKELVNRGLRLILDQLENSSQILNTEAIFVKVQDQFSNKTLWQELGYEIIDLDEIKVNIWKKTARKLVEEDHILMFKEMRSDRVLLPL
jgi:dephospho-CoA kinase